MPAILRVRDGGKGCRVYVIERVATMDAFEFG
jgi:hypothetical protein